MNPNRFRTLVANSTILLAVTIATSCGSQTSDTLQGTDTSSHWLASCTVDSTCPTGQSCLCGVCTRACDDALDCRNLDADALCLPESDCSTPRICTLESRVNPSDGTEPCDGSQCPTDTNSTQPSPQVNPPPPAPTTLPPTSSPACEFLFETASTPAACVANEAQCEQFPTGSVERTVILILDETKTTEDGGEVPYTNEELEQRRNCVGNWLSELGLSSTLGEAFVRVTSTWPDVAPILESAAFTAYDLTCADCGYCSDLDATGCNADAFCMPYIGRRVNEDLGCLEQPAMLECMATGINCDDAITVAGDGDDCWIFSTGCATRSLSPGSQNCASWSDSYLDDFETGSSCGDAGG